MPYIDDDDDDNDIFSDFFNPESKYHYLTQGQNELDSSSDEENVLSECEWQSEGGKKYKGSITVQNKRKHHSFLKTTIYNFLQSKFD